MDEQRKTGISRRTFLKTTAIGTGGLALSSFGVPRLLKAAAEPIKIGCITPLTGPMTGYGIPTKAAMEYACEKVNASGGIMGRKVIPLFRDEQLSPEVTVRAVKDLVINEGCVFVGGCISSADSIAASIAVKGMNGKAFWTAYCSSASEITEEKFHRYTSRVSINATAWTRCVAFSSAERWGDRAKTLYCLNANYNYGHSCKNAFVEHWKKVAPQVKLVGESWPPLGSTDFTSYITAILAAKPDIVQSSLFGGDAVIFMKQASAYGLLQKVKFVDQDIGIMPFLNNLQQGDPAAPIGALTATCYPFYLFEDEENVEFYSEVYAKTKWYPDMMAYSPPMYLEFIKAAMEKAGTTTDLEKVIDVFDSGLTVKTMIGDIELRGCDHQTLVPYWVGTLGWDPQGKFPMPIMVKDINKLDNYAELYHSCKEIEILRSNTKK